jgi:hypothetical protein
MGIVICKQHGRAGIVETCIHVGQDIDQGRFGEYERISLVGALILCRRCYTATGYDKFGKYSGASIEAPVDDAVLEEMEASYGRIAGRRTICSECVAAVQVEQARREGKKDPFPVYEKTMTSHDHDCVEALESHLTRHFDFKKSIVAKNRVAVFVTAGNYRWPLTVRVFYVRDRLEQDKIVSLATAFLKDLPLNQAKVEFWEAEIWNTWTNPQSGVSGGCRGNEVLLREAYLNCG